MGLVCNQERNEDSTGVGRSEAVIGRVQKTGLGATILGDICRNQNQPW